MTNELKTRLENKGFKFDGCTDKGSAIFIKVGTVLMIESNGSWKSAPNFEFRSNETTTGRNTSSL